MSLEIVERYRRHEDERVSAQQVLKEEREKRQSEIVGPLENGKGKSRQISLWGRKLECRLPQYSDVSVGSQADAFFSGSRIEAEQGQNEPSHCKTDRPLVQCGNPGALAGATGANSSGLTSKGKDTPKPGRSAISKWAEDRHKRATRALGFGIIADSPETWADVGEVLTLRLTAAERAALGFTCLAAVEPQHRAEVALAACHDLPSAGAPLPAFSTPEAEAEGWAALAERRELRAYARACLARLRPDERERIVGDLSREERRAAA